LKKKNPASREGALVLLVEDHQDVRDMYADYLKYSGFSVIAAANGAEGVDAARTEHPDLILMDATMPGIDGWEATRLLKADAATRDIPILMLTAHVFSEYQTRARDVGADGFIAKPCLPDELVREVTVALARWQSARKGDTDQQRSNRAHAAMKQSKDRITKSRATGKKRG
jgi:two-component system cell cycle response regulator DivK